jgi:hypothetical protein
MGHNGLAKVNVGLGWEDWAGNRSRAWMGKSELAKNIVGLDGKRGQAKERVDLEWERVGLEWERVGWQREGRAWMGKSLLVKERVGLEWERVS